MGILIPTEVITAQMVADRETQENRWHEIVNGAWVEVEMPSFEHGGIGFNIGSEIRDFLKENPIGKVRTDGVSYVLKGTPDNVEIMRIPDVSFISLDKLANVEPGGYVYAAPDIAVEVISKSERPGTTYDKMSDYFEYGTQQVWLVYPDRQMVVVHFPDGTTDTYKGQDVLTCEAVLPGFKLPLSAIFAE